MRTSEQFRDRQISFLALALQRPGMACGYGQMAEQYYRNTLSDLSWLDERETEMAAVDRELVQLPSTASLVCGQFCNQYPAIPERCTNEIASVYAQAGYRLGYYSPKRLLTETEFAELKNSMDARFLASDHTESEIVSRFGKPTHDVLGGQTTVHCYGCCDRNANWVYFDYSRCYPPKDPHSYEWFDDAILRDIRRKNNEMELLPFAKWCCEGQDERDS
jgi:hypothetical protein